MDLREHELEGHSQRVTRKTLELARFIGVDDGQLVHIRRGALLHDVGKIGVPDSILRKPGPLTAEEWTIMRQHPECARSLLEPIAYLQPAIDIPFCHHERWDGQGYPRGLSGEQIPWAARIFSVVDVWDALTSDRPYRQAWPVDRVRRYILDNSGTAFDPDVASAFLALPEEWEREEIDLASEEIPTLRLSIPPEPSTDPDERRYDLATIPSEVSLGLKADSGRIGCPHRSSRRSRLTISMAASAASKPLLPALSPARLRACSSVSEVRMPKMTGTPVAKPGLHHARGRLAGDVVVMAGLAADHAAQADHRRIPAALGQLARDQRDLERARHPDQVDRSSATPWRSRASRHPVQKRLQ